MHDAVTSESQAVTVRRRQLAPNEIGQYRYATYRLFSNCVTQLPAGDLLQRFSARGSARPLHALMSGDLKSPGWFPPSEAARLSAEYAALFLLPGARQTRPYETCYRELQGGAGQRRPEPRLGLVAIDVQRAYVEYGMPSVVGVDESPDHAGVELRFMANLVRAEARFRQSGDRAAADKAVRGEREFLSRHILCWFPDWLGCVRECARMPFYHRFGVLLSCFLTTERVVLGL